MTKTMHLYRGAPAVRSWSKYQETVEDWTLCGIRRQKRRDGLLHPRQCTENAFQVSCPYCLDLMRPSAKNQRVRKSAASPFRYMSRDEVPLGVRPLWPDSDFLLNGTTGELWECGPRFERKIPGTFFFEFVFDEITEVSLVDKPANKYARVALWK
jgi:hypothetical protein